MGLPCDGIKLARPSTSLRYAQGERSGKSAEYLPFVLSGAVKRRSRSTSYFLNLTALGCCEIASLCCSETTFSDSCFIQTCCDDRLRPSKESFLPPRPARFVLAFPHPRGCIQRLDAGAQLPPLLTGSNKTSELLGKESLETAGLGDKGIRMVFY